MITTTPPSDEFEALLRTRLQQLADAAPTTVRSITDVPVIADVGGDRPRPRRRLAGIGATVAALVGVAGITTVTFSGAGDTGAASPEEAVLQFADALAREDILGMIDVADPAEVPALRRAFEAATDEAKRLELLDGAFSLDGVSGLDVTIDGLVLSTEQLAPDVALVTATSGVIGTSFDPGAFAFGRNLADVATESTTTVTDLGDPESDVQLATVQRDGRWFVSLSYTVAEYARQAAGVDVPTAAAITPEGFDSPADAATAFYSRVLDTDFAGAVATAAPGEGDALARYASLWLPTADEAAGRAVVDGLDVALTSVGYDVTGDGNRRRVEATSFVIEGTVPADWWSNTGLPERDPTLPTLISTADSQGFVIVPAGEPIPATLDGREVIPHDEMSFDDRANYTYENPDGSVQPLREATDAAPAGPTPVRIERSGGCTTYRGEVIGSFGFEPSAAEQLDDTTWRSCNGQPLDLVNVLVLAVGSLDRLPTIDTVEIDGSWYVSPIGSIANSVLDVIRAVPDSSSLFDSSLAWYVYGIDRATLETYLLGRYMASLSVECATVVTDDGGRVTGTVDDPTLAQIRACEGADLYDGDWYPATVADEVTASSAVAVPETVPAPDPTG
jgi:hypothetical protein